MKNLAYSLVLMFVAAGGICLALLAGRAYATGPNDASPRAAKVASSRCGCQDPFLETAMLVSSSKDDIGLTMTSWNFGFTCKKSQQFSTIYCAEGMRPNGSVYYFKCEPISCGN